MNVQLIAIEVLRPHELVDATHVEYLTRQIVEKGHWLRPIVVDRESHIVMDGHHRLEAARRVGLSKIPCALLDYNSDDIRVVETHSGIAFDVALIKSAAECGDRLPIKSTKHIFSANIDSVDIPLEQLR